MERETGEVRQIILWKLSIVGNGGICVRGMALDSNTDSDNDGLDDTTESTSCNNAIAQTATVNGSNALITTLDFGGASTALFYVSLNAFINLDNQTIQMVAYDHFSSASDIVLGNHTNTLTSGSSSYATVAFQLMGNQLQIIQVFNACGDGVLSHSIKPKTIE